jgi:hypothetical protein
VELRVFGRVWLSRLSYAVFISSALAEVEALIALQSGKSSTLGEAVIIAQRDNEGGQSMYNVGNCLECEFGAGDEPGPFTGNREAPNRYVDPVL